MNLGSLLRGVTGGRRSTGGHGTTGHTGGTRSGGGIGESIGRTVDRKAGGGRRGGGGGLGGLVRKFTGGRRI